MNNLYKLEFKKLKRQKSIYICIAVLIGMLVLVAVALKITQSRFSDVEAFAPYLKDLSGFNFMLSAVSNSYYLLVIGIITAITYCADFEEQTVKNIFSRGYSRSTFYFAKLTSIWIICTIMYITTTAFAFLIGSIFFGVGSEDVLRCFTLIGIQYLACMGYMTFYVGVSALIRKNGGVIASNIIIPILIILVLGLIDAILNSDTFKAVDIWLDSFSNDMSKIDASTPRMIGCTIGSVIYIVAFIIIGNMISKKTEV